jgi:tetraacyldisaccharide-1-P 4'-kinase
VRPAAAQTELIPSLKDGLAPGHSVKNRLHIDIHASGDEPHASAGRRILLAVRKQRVDAEASRLVALGATLVAVLSTDGLDHYAIAMRDPEGNEFDIN